MRILYKKNSAPIVILYKIFLCLKNCAKNVATLKGYQIVPVAKLYNNFSNFGTIKRTSYIL